MFSTSHSPLPFKFSCSGALADTGGNYTLHELIDSVYDEATPTQPDYSSLGTNSEGLDTYDVTDHNQLKTNTPQAKPANPTPVGDEASKRRDDFYDAEEHTYSVANTKHKKKAKTEPAAGGGEWEGPSVYDMAMLGETSWGSEKKNTLN